MRGFIALMALCAAVIGAYGQDHSHPPQHAQLHEQFYNTWMRPDMPAVSCCNKMDCAPAEARFRNGQWFARQEGTQAWLSVPPEKIETNRDSPDSRSHLCANSTGVLCFIPGAGI